MDRLHRDAVPALPGPTLVLPITEPATPVEE